MSYCVNPYCKNRQNDEQAQTCAACGQSLLVIGRFRVIRPIVSTRGRRTEVLEAIDLKGSFISDRNSPKILKTLLDDDPKMVELFVREAESYRYFNHPGIPRSDMEDLFTFRTCGGEEFHCYAMTKIEGTTVEEWIRKKGALSETMALDWLQQLSEILQLIHGKGWFHRDIKPSNIMVQPDGKLALIDFGAVRQFGDTYLAKLACGGPGYELTQVHTLGYTSPEQMNGRALPQSDLYSLGKTLIFCVTGKTFMEIPINRETGDMLWQAECPQISQNLKSLLESLTATSLRDRPKTAQEILDWLSEGLSSSVQMNSSSEAGSSRIAFGKLWQYRPSRFFVLGLMAIAVIGLLNLGKVQIAHQFLLTANAQANHEDEWNKAKASFEDSIRLNPNSEAYNQFGRFCQKIKDINCAIRNFKNAIETKPTDIDPYMNLGNLYEDLADVNNARSIYQNAIKVTQGKHPSPLINLMRLNILSGNLPDAELIGNQVLKINGLSRYTLARLYKNWAWIYLLKGEYNDAQTYAGKAITFDSQFVSPYCILAQVKEKLKISSDPEWDACITNIAEDQNYPEVKQWSRSKLRNMRKL